ncbi:rhomboid family protein [Leptospira ryugenii]|uniref:Rhomboid family protein n=1 Tax=Leptospira ryugenii TaxID=1917863 RepID=A0A2P2DZD5_9LEPT|nr:rhomboid family intramembrane serine protease [Leptospira ryugenii]GBF49946.1 rhomboid family protein [Leptospira ryugenii]
MSGNRQEKAQLFGNPITHPLNVILIINCLVYILQNFADQQLVFRFGLIPDFVLHGAFWQVVTYGFLHSTAYPIPVHLMFNMYGFYMLGTYLIPILGKQKFVLLYALSQLGGGLLVVFSALLNSILGGNIILLDHSNIPTIGASGAVFGLLAVFGELFPQSELLLIVFRIKAKNAIWVSLAIGYAFTILGDSGISNTCHLGGALVGLVFYRMLKDRLPKNQFSYMAGMDWEEEEGPKKSERKPEPNLADLFMDQKKANESLLSKLAHMPDNSIQIKYLQDYQVADANICPPSTYNPEDPICLRCEWLPNCALRRAKG